MWVRGRTFFFKKIPPPPPRKLISTIFKSTFCLNCDYWSPNWCKIWWKSLKKQTFPKVWMKCFEIARLQNFTPNTPGLLGALSSQTPAVIALCIARCATRDDERPPSGNPISCLRACIYTIILQGLYPFWVQTVWYYI